MKQSQAKPRRRRHTESEREEIIAEYRTSGLSQAHTTIIFPIA